MSVAPPLAEDVLDELEALRAIYGPDFVEKSVSWSDLDEHADIWGMPSFCIRVKPLDKSVDHRFTQAEVLFTLRIGYPHVAPRVAFTSSDGLSTLEFEALKGLVDQRANEEAAKGEVMIHFICSAIEEFLSDQNKDIKPKSLFEISKAREETERDALLRLRKEMAEQGTEPQKTLVSKTSHSVAFEITHRS